MFEIRTHDARLIATAATAVEALTIALDLPTAFRPYSIARAAVVTPAVRAEARRIARSSLERAWDRGEIEWIDGMPVAIA